MSLRKVTRRVASAGLFLLLAGCAQTFTTAYEPAVGAENWRVSAVNVTVPDNLVVSEEDTLLPRAEILWQEEPLGDRRAQVAAIMKTAITQGAADAKGPVPVVLDVTMTRFHALTARAEKIAPGGVHDIEFDMTVKNARNGDVLYGPAHMQASLPALTGSAMAVARLNGDSQKKQIIAHVAKTIAGWLGHGEDQRRTFQSVGG